MAFAFTIRYTKICCTVWTSKIKHDLFTQNFYL